MNSIKLLRLEMAGLESLVINQIRAVIPDGNFIDTEIIRRNLPEALERLRVCLASVRVWETNVFDHLHSSQYCIFLYYLANTIWRNDQHTEIAVKLFLLNKMLNGIDLFYEIDMPDRFFIGHSVGVVLAKARYSDYFAVYQNCTVGKNHGLAPEIDSNVLMYPNSAIIGRCKVRSGTVVSQGTSIINQDSLENHIVFPGESQRNLLFKPIRTNGLNDIFW